MHKQKLTYPPADPEAARFDTTNSCKADNKNAGLPKNFSRVSSRNTLTDQCDRFELGISQALQCAAVDGTTAGKSDDDIDIRVRGNCILHTGVDGYPTSECDGHRKDRSWRPQREPIGHRNNRSRADPGYHGVANHKQRSGFVVAVLPSGH